MVNVISKHHLGWSVHFTYPYSIASLSVFAAIIIGIIGAYYPTTLATRLTVKEAIHFE